MTDEMRKRLSLWKCQRGHFFSMLRFKIHYCIAVCPIHPTDFVERVLCIVAGDDEAYLLTLDPVTGRTTVVPYTDKALDAYLGK